MPRNMTVAACQFHVRPIRDFDEFASHAGGLLDQAGGADLVLFPELFTVELFTTLKDWKSLPASELHRITEYTEAYEQFFASEARRRGQHLVAGSHLVRTEGDQVLNVAYLFGPDGLLHRHAKTHIFPAEADWRTTEGDALDVINLPFAKVGFNICYEAEIPECAATLTEQGAEIILCPSFTFTEFGFWRVRHCAQARCVENQVYFVHCCTGGQPGEPLPDGFARSSVLSPCDVLWNPNGVVAQADANREMVISATIDIDRIYENRDKGAAPTYRDRRRRADLYMKWPSHVG